MFEVEPEQTKEVTKLVTNGDFNKYAVKIALKLQQNSKETKYLRSFFKTLLNNVYDVLKKEDFESMKDKIESIIDQKAKDEANALKNKSKKLNIHRGDRDVNIYDDYMMEDNSDEDYDYRGKDDDYEFM